MSSIGFPFETARRYFCNSVDSPDKLGLPNEMKIYSTDSPMSDEWDLKHTQKVREEVKIKAVASSSQKFGHHSSTDARLFSKSKNSQMKDNKANEEDEEHEEHEEEDHDEKHEEHERHEENEESKVEADDAKKQMQPTKKRRRSKENENKGGEMKRNKIGNVGEYEGSVSLCGRAQTNAVIRETLEKSV